MCHSKCMVMVGKFGNESILHGKLKASFSLCDDSMMFC